MGQLYNQTVMPSCSAFGCTNSTTKGYRLFSFPADKKLRSIWECKVSRNNWKASINSRLCEKHFEPSDFELKRKDGKKKLRWKAIPTIFTHRTPVKHRKLPKIRGEVVKHTAELGSAHDHTYSYCKKFKRKNYAARRLRSSIGLLRLSSAKMGKARKWIVEKKFEGEATLDNFRLVEEDLPQLKDGEILIEALFLTVDPYMRVFPYKVGQPPIGQQVARVTESKNVKYPVGKLVLAMVGWRDKTVLSPDAESLYAAPPIIPRDAISDLPDLGNFSPSLFLGVLGMPGLTAYFGLLDKCKPKPGDVVLVSTAAGAVGSVVGQIAKIKGCTVIGSAGSQEKCEWLKTLGFDHVFNYKETSVEEALRLYAPSGVDCYFDNVGGDYALTVLSTMRRYGRVCACGQISEYNATKVSRDALERKDVINLIMIKELVVSGIMVYSFIDRFGEGLKDMAQWIKEGKLKYEETVREDFLKLPDAFFEIFKGTAKGKLIVKV